MKNGILLSIIILVFSCGSTKSTVQKTEVHTPEKISVVDKAIKQTPSPIETDSIAKTTEVTIVINQPKEHNQVVEEKPINVHEDWNDLLQKHVSKNGIVDYKGFKNDRAQLVLYFKQLSQVLPKGTDSKAYTLAYWINAYNAFTIDLILRHYPVKSIKDIKKPWDQRYWKLGDKWYNLNEIEHDILRQMDEPRIHFAIVCASVSCPSLLNEAYTPDYLENQLTQATLAFLNDKTKNNITENSLELSNIFQWFAKDFKQHGSLIDFINQYTAIEISAKAKKTYKDYNWDLNN